MTDDVRREIFDSFAPKYMNEDFTTDGVREAAFLMDLLGLPSEATADGVSVRRATPEDADGVAAVLNAAIGDGSPTLLDTPVSVEDERAYIESLPARAFIHVAEERGEVVGFQAVIPWSDFITTAHDHVATMGTFVRSSHRRRGAGTALARASFAAALALGYEKLFTDLRADNLASLAYHLSLGFTVVGTARGHARTVHGDVDVLFVERFLREE